MPHRSPLDRLVGGLSLPVVRVLDRLPGADPSDGAMMVADPRESLAEIRRAAATITPGAHVGRAVYHRYLLGWSAPRVRT